MLQWSIYNLSLLSIYNLSCLIYSEVCQAINSSFYFCLLCSVSHRKKNGLNFYFNEATLIVTHIHDYDSFKCHIISVFVVISMNSILSAHVTNIILYFSHLQIFCHHSAGKNILSFFKSTGLFKVLWLSSNINLLSSILFLVLISLVVFVTVNIHVCFCTGLFSGGVPEPIWRNKLTNEGMN